MIVNNVNTDTWERWNNHIFREKKPAILLTMYVKDKRKKEIIDHLRRMTTAIPTLIMEPKDFKRIFRDADEYMDPPVMLCFWGGELVGHYLDGDLDYPIDSINDAIKRIG